MKAFWNWIVRNISNVFSFLGICLTLYFGIFYVPAWLEDARKEKFRSAQENLKQSVKELIFSDSLSTLAEISFLVKAKEIELGENYPLSTEEILVGVQESFMEDRFLPLAQRRDFIREIEAIKDQIPTQTAEEINVKKPRENKAWEWLSVILSLFLGTSGIWGFYSKYKKDKAKDEELRNQFSEIEKSRSTQEAAYEYEALIIENIMLIPQVELKTSDVHNEEFDLEFEYQGHKNFVEVKYLSRSKIGLKSITSFLSKIQGLEGIFWFVHNSEFTEMARKKLVEIKNLETKKRRIRFLQVTDLEGFKERFENSLKEN